MLLSLVRHAKSDQHAALADRERPLNERGRRASVEMARRWRARALVPDLLLSSPAVRAHETARGLAAGFGIDPDGIRLDERLYPGSAGLLLEVIHGTPADIAHLMVVGHNPGISELARMLCAELPLAEMPTAALCTLRAGVRSWLSIETAGIELLACDWPKNSTGARRQP